MKKYEKYLLILILVSTTIRALMAATIELGNDEVYYRIFGLFPSMSYFDHPPLLAWIIRATTFASHQPVEILIRLSSIIIGAINTILIFKIAGGNRRGIYASMLYTGSIYASIIVGVFIMPDTPMSLFWLIALYIFTRILPPQIGSKISRKENYLMLAAGVAIGFAMLSKYTGAYLWGAAGLYVLIFNRRWFCSWGLYVASLLSIVIFLPVIIWNIDNDFISFTFHSARVTADSSVNWLYFGRELLGGIFYNNPINYALIIVSILAWRRRKYIDAHRFWLFIIFSVPMVAMFGAISLTRETLPHWAAPSFFALIILAAYYLDGIKVRLAARWVWSSVSLIAIVFVVGWTQINRGVINLSQQDEKLENLGRGDVTLDMYGWRQLGGKFNLLRAADIANGTMPAHAPIVSYRWDEAAHLDCYVALPLDIKLTTLTGKENTHFYHWISDWRGKYSGGDAYVIVSSRVYNPNDEIFAIFDIEAQKKPTDTILIERNGRPVEAFMVYRFTSESLLQPL